MKANRLIVLLAATLLWGCGKKEEATAPEAAAPAPEAVAVPSVGESAYKKACAMCHTPGTAGAPKIGDKADWDARLAQGVDVLYKNSIDGYTGSKGVMPAKGGNPSMSDDDVKAAVDHLLAMSK